MFGVGAGDGPQGQLCRCCNSPQHSPGGELQCGPWVSPQKLLNFKGAISEFGKFPSLIYLLVKQLVLLF